MTLQTHQLNSIERIRDFILGTDPVHFSFSDRTQAHQWITESSSAIIFGLERIHGQDWLYCVTKSGVACMRCIYLEIAIELAT